MTTKTSPLPTPEAIAEAVDADKLVESVRQAIAIPSVTPNERDFAIWVHEQMGENIWDQRQLALFDDTRANVYATVGTDNPSSQSVVLAGHLDTVHCDDWTNHWHGTERANPYGAQIIDGEIWGRGSADQKAGVCIILEALRAIRRKGCKPKGTVKALFVSDEESGQPNSGISMGMKKALADNQIRKNQLPDFCIYTEPTKSAIYTAQMGFLIADITLVGKSAYFGRPELGVDALKAGHRLLESLWAHSETLRHQNTHPLIGEAFLVVTEVHSGESISVPEKFQLSLIRKVLPHESLDEAAQAISGITAQVAEEHKVETTVDFSAPRDHPKGGTADETPLDHPGVQAFGQSIKAVTGVPPRYEAAPYWSEKSFLSAMGIPGVYFAPGDISHAHTPYERVGIDELISAARTLAHFVATWGGLEPTPGTATTSTNPTIQNAPQTKIT